MKNYFIILFISCCLGCNEYSIVKRRNEKEVGKSVGTWLMISKKIRFSSPFENLIPDKLILSIEPCTFGKGYNICSIKYKIDDYTEKSASFSVWQNPAKTPVMKMKPIENQQGYSEKEKTFHDSGLEITDRSSNGLSLSVSGGKITYDLELIKQ